jgi:hypothetical protein
VFGVEVREQLATRWRHFNMCRRILRGKDSWILSTGATNCSFARSRDKFTGQRHHSGNQRSRFGLSQAA